VSQDDRAPLGDGDLVIAFAVTFLLCLGKVAFAIAGGETFGAEDTLALLLVVLLAWLARGWFSSLASITRKRWGVRPD
jgi:hypothetical protein